ncbi:serine/threonine-protein kinase [Agrococcus casei]|uniref:serine/threonine-protein kinase n=1 Tax=Agrococcus casei TaxID=343512 RepID=UPI003F8F632F
MKTKRAPGEPPKLPGFEYSSLLGSGGFADVFLYDQQLPRRQVAVKVLVADANDERIRSSFRREANLMAQLSAHPAIVTIHAAAVSDDGRPFIVMEYCPKPNLGVQYKRDRFSVPEVLALGVQIAGAVESAHRVGILHRDIKPANILVTQYRRPALTDFGIATTDDGQPGGGGMSIPWSPPEAFGSPPEASAASDTFSLAATLYTLLAGRSPFELPGHSNSSLDLTRRIRSGDVTPLTRSDVPDSLRQLFEIALDPEPERRYTTALSLGHALQRIETELSLPVTTIDVFEEVDSEHRADDDDGATRVRGVIEVPDAPSASQETHAVVVGGGDRSETRGSLDETSQAAPAHPPRSPLLRRVLAGAAAAVVLLVVGAVLLTIEHDDDVDAQAPPPVTPGQGAQRPPAPIAVEATAEGDQATFTWVNPQPQAGDTYRVRVDTDLGQEAPVVVTEPQITVDLREEGATCVMVTLVREQKTESTATEGCIGE